MNSAHFTIDDIHRIREDNYNKTKDLSLEDRLNYYKTKATAFLEEGNIQPQRENNLAPKNLILQNCNIR